MRSVKWKSAEINYVARRLFMRLFTYFEMPCVAATVSNLFFISFPCLHNDLPTARCANDILSVRRCLVVHSKQLASSRHQYSSPMTSQWHRIFSNSKIKLLLFLSSSPSSSSPSSLPVRFCIAAFCSVFEVRFCSACLPWNWSNSDCVHIEYTNWRSVGISWTHSTTTMWPFSRVEYLPQRCNEAISIASSTN